MAGRAGRRSVRPAWARPEARVAPRGLIPAAGLFVAGLIVLSRSPRPLAPLAAGFGAGLIAIFALGGVRLFTATLFDVTYWIHNDRLWRQPLQIAVLPPALLS